MRSRVSVQWPDNGEDINDDVLGASLKLATDSHFGSLARKGNRMTDKEALQEAQRRLGEKAFARDQSGGPDRFKVGTKSFAGVFLVNGVGQSWEEAFLAADRNAQKQP